MQPVSKPQFSFTKLASEFDYIETNKRKRLQVEQIIAKLHRKKGTLDSEELEMFKHFSEGKSPDELVSCLLDSNLPVSIETIKGLRDLWEFLDGLITHKTKLMLYSEHQDVLKETYQGAVRRRFFR